MLPLEIDLDSLKVNVKNLHQAGDIATSQLKGRATGAEVENARGRFGCARKADHAYKA